MLAERLSAVADDLSQVVDARLRAILQQDYLTLLKAYQDGGRRENARLADRAAMLLKRVRAASTSYMFDPGLGTIGYKFERAWDVAQAAMGRLRRIVSAQGDSETRYAWSVELSNLHDKLNRLYSEMQFASANVNLSRMDALANEANGIITIHLLPRERSWGKAVGLAAGPLPVPRGDSGLISKYSAPRAWRARGMALSGWYEDYQEAVTEAYQKGRKRVAGNAGTLMGLWRRSVERLGKLGKRLAAIRKPALKESLLNTQMQYENLVARYRALAAQMKTQAAFDAPQQSLERGLGQDQRGSAAVLFYARDIRELAAGVDELDAALRRLERV